MFSSYCKLVPLEESPDTLLDEHDQPDVGERTVWYIGANIIYRTGTKQ